MAEPESIMQLGIDAAREGNVEEARNLFRLLTRQEPNNAQAWLWLAGVLESRDDRIAAVERALEIEPNNDLARKTMQRLQSQSPKPAPTPPPAPVAAPVADNPYADIDDDDPFAQLDELSEVMANEPAPKRPETRRLEDDDNPFDDDFEAALASSPSAVRATDRSTERAATRRGGADGLPPVMSSSSANRSSSRRRDDDDEEYMATTQPNRRNPILLAVLTVLFVVVLIFFAFQFFSGGDEQQIVTPTPEPGSEIVANPTDPALTETDPAESAPTEPSETEPVETEPGQPEPEPAPTEPEPAPTEPEQPGSPIDPATVNPAQVAPGEILSVNNLAYNFPVPNFATSFPGGVGNVQPQGRFVLVLMYLSNATGQPLQINADTFLLRDDQGRIYQANPAASSAYLIPGINGDISQETPLPADSLTRSMPLFFDVAPDATNLVFFARENPDQGYLVLAQP